MPYYHVRIHCEEKDGFWNSENTGFSTDQINELAKAINEGKPFMLKNTRINPSSITGIGIWKTEKRTKDWDWIRAYGENVTNDFVITLHDKPSFHQKSGTETGNVPSEEIKTTQSKNIFIVHGRDHKPMKELKTMLKEFGLNPIILHEQPSGSRTIVEKLEKYSGVGYAFVILAPDDIGVSRHLSRRNLTIMGDQSIIEEALASKELNIKAPFSWKKNFMNLFPSFMKMRARQNVVLEFGYFMGLLGRDKVCCLYKGDIELPSDMHGIVYIAFKESVNEVKDKIIKELTEADYEIKLRNAEKSDAFLI